MIEVPVHVHYLLPASATLGPAVSESAPAGVVATIAAGFDFDAVAPPHLVSGGLQLLL